MIFSLSPTAKINRMHGAKKILGNHLMVRQPSHWKNAIRTCSQSIGPVAIIGGTLSVYSSALKHSSSTLTPISAIYLFLLAFQYSIVPRLTNKYIDKRTNKESIALVEEVVKMIMGISFYLLSSYNNTSMTMSQTITSTINQFSLTSSIMAAGLPSALYAIQGVLTYTSYQHLDPVTFNGLTQLKTLSAALCCYIVLGKMQSGAQLFALFVLSLSSLIFQQDSLSLLNVDFHRMKYDFRNFVTSLVNGIGKAEYVTDNNNDDGNDGIIGRRSDVSVPINLSKRFVCGIIPCLMATFLSGLAGSFSQKSLQTVKVSSSLDNMMKLTEGGLINSQNGRNAYFYSAEISFFSALYLVITLLSKRLYQGRYRHDVRENKSKDNKTISNDGRDLKSDISDRYFEYWTPETLIPIALKALGGVLTALVHKHCGSVMKGFALVLGLVFTGLLQSIIDGKELSVPQCVATVLVLYSSFLHFTNPLK